MIDLKIGSVTWSPDAPPSKVKQEMSKYVGTKGPLGLCLTGMHYYVEDPTTKSLKRTVMGREQGKLLDVPGFRGSLRDFFSNCDKRLVKVVVDKLEGIRDVIARLSKRFRLFGSSILIAYDAEGPDVDSVRVFMIDFAHFHEVEGGGSGVDENYLKGVGNLIGIVEELHRDKCD